MLTTQYPRQFYQAPKSQARELSQEEKAARYDQFVNLRAARYATHQEIAKLKRQLEKLDAEENKVLGVGYTVEECSNCHGHHEGSC